MAQVLVGREPELAAIDTFIERVTDRGGSLVLLGDAGIGKTALLDAATDAASARAMEVLRAAGTEFEADVSFAGLHQVLFPLRERHRESWDATGDVLDVALGFAVGPAPDRLVVANAVLDLLRRAASTRPTLVVVDDLQWIDRPSATVLALVARRFDGSPVGFVGAIRTGEDSFFEHAGLPELEVPPLEPGDAGGLLDDRFPVLAPRARADVLIEASGNPLALLELPGSSTGARPVAAATSFTGHPPGRRLQTLFAARIAALPDATGQLLLFAALDGSGDLRVLETAAAPDGLVHLDAAEKAGLVYVDADSHRMTFRHPLIRTALVTQATNEERRRAHHALALALADDPERRAWHLADAAIGPDEVIAQLLDDTAHRTLRRGDATGAVAALTRSSDLTPDASARGRRLAEAAYIGANANGTLADASSLLAEARRSALDGAGALYAATAAAYLLINGDGDVDTAYRLLVRAIENECESSTTDWTALEGALGALQSLCYLGASTELWAPFHAALAHFPPPVPTALYLAGTVFADPCRSSAEVLGHLDNAIAGLTDADPMSNLLTSSVSVFVDRLPECRQPLLQLVEDGRSGGVVALAITALALLATSSLLTGEWDEAEAFSDEGIEMAETNGFEFGSWFPRQTKAMLAAYRGDEETARKLAGDMMHWATPRRARAVHTFWNMALHFAALGAGDFETAYQRATAIAPCGQLPPYVSTTVYTLFGQVEAALRTGRQAEAAAHVRAMRDANLSAISSRLALQVAGSEAMVAPLDQAAAMFERAIALPDADRWPFDLARVRLAYGEYLRRTRAITDARVQLDTALATFDLLRAKPWSARAEKELRATGVGTAVAAGGRSEALTAQEQEVASLAASGLTNRQIGEQLYMSPRTVGAHLYRVFPKLGITSRAALRDALTAHDNG